MQITTTRWLDKTKVDLSSIESLFLAEHPDELSDTSASYINWKIEKFFSENKKSVFNGKEIEYNYYTYSVDRIPIGSDVDEDITVTKNGFVIPYLSNGRIRYIINRNAEALTILRKMLFYKGKGEITKNNPKANEDLFVWLINKIYNRENIFESESDVLDKLCIDSIRGFKGDTEDFLTKVSASGETVMNIISSLSFLIESKYLNQITLDITYRNHKNIEVTFSSKDTISTSIDRYLGELAESPKEEIYSTIFLLLYTEILPIIIQNYQIEVEGNQWGQSKCVEFLQKVADELSEKVRIRIEDLMSRPEQLKLALDSSMVVNNE